MILIKNGASTKALTEVNGSYFREIIKDGVECQKGCVFVYDLPDDEITLDFSKRFDSGAEVAWGDGSFKSKDDTTLTHTYAQKGLYSIQTHISSLTASTFPKADCLKKIYFSSEVNEIKQFLTGITPPTTNLYINFDCSACNEALISVGTSDQKCTIEFGPKVTSIPGHFIWRPTTQKPLSCIENISFYEPSNCTEIAEYAFNDINATCIDSITIPSSMKTLHPNAFSTNYDLSDGTYQPTHLSKIIFNATAMDDPKEDGFIFPKAGQNLYPMDGVTITVGPQVTRIPAYLFSAKDLDTFNIKKNYAYLTHIDFSNAEACTSIGDGAFRYTYIQDITMPSNLTYIGNNAFEKCTGLRNITFNDKVTHIGESAFKSSGGLSGLDCIRLPECPVTVGENAFDGCDTKKIIIPNIVNYCKNTYANDAASPVRVSLNTLADDGFVDGNGDVIQQVILTDEDGVTRIPKYSFHTIDAINMIDLPSTIETIEQSAFYAVQASSLTLHEGLKTIEGDGLAGALANDTSDLLIPESVTTVGLRGLSLNDCRNMTVPAISLRDANNAKHGTHVGIAGSVITGNLTVFSPKSVESSSDYIDIPTYWADSLHFINRGESVLDRGSFTATRVPSLAFKGDYAMFDMPYAADSTGCLSKFTKGGLDKLEIDLGYLYRDRISDINSASSSTWLVSLFDTGVVNEQYAVSIKSLYLCGGNINSEDESTTQIPYGLCYGLDNLQAVHISNCTHICAQAFFDCPALQTVSFDDLPADAEVQIGKFAFAQTALKGFAMYPQFNLSEAYGLFSGTVLNNLNLTSLTHEIDSGLLYNASITYELHTNEMSSYEAKKITSLYAHSENTTSINLDDAQNVSNIICNGPVTYIEGDGSQLLNLTLGACRDMSETKLEENSYAPIFGPTSQFTGYNLDANFGVATSTTSKKLSLHCYIADDYASKVKLYMGSEANFTNRQVDLTLHISNGDYSDLNKTDSNGITGFTKFMRDFIDTGYFYGANWANGIASFKTTFKNENGKSVSYQYTSGTWSKI